MADSREVKNWLEKAAEDYLFASSIISETTFYAQVCFFFQQAAEKYLKAYIIRDELEFKKVHDLTELLRICEGHLPSFSILIEDCRLLNTYYIETRYPVHWPVSVGKEDAYRAMEAAGRIKDFVEKVIEI